MKIDPVTPQKPDSLYFLQASEYLNSLILNEKSINSDTAPAGSYYSNVSIVKRVSLLLPFFSMPFLFFIGDSLPLINFSSTFMISFIFGTLLILPLFHITDILYGNRAAFFASLLMCFHPILIYHSASGCGENIYFFIALTASFFFIKALIIDRNLHSNPKNNKRFLFYLAVSSLLWGLSSYARPEGMAMIFSTAVIVLFLQINKHKNIFKPIIFKILLIAIIPGCLMLLPQIAINNFIDEGLRRLPKKITIDDKLYFPASMGYAIEHKSSPGDLEIANQWGTFLSESMGFKEWLNIINQKFQNITFMSLPEKLLCEVKNISYFSLIEPSPILFLMAITGLFIKQSNMNSSGFILLIIGFAAILPIPFVIISYNIYFHIFILFLLPSAGAGVQYFSKKGLGATIIVLLALSFSFILKNQYSFVKKGSIPVQPVMKNWFAAIPSLEENSLNITQPQKEQIWMLCNNPWTARAAGCQWMPPPPSENPDYVHKMLKQYDVKYVAVDSHYRNIWPELKPTWIKSINFKNNYKFIRTFSQGDYRIEIYQKTL